MRLKIALLCALFVGFGNVRAGVVGISPTGALLESAAGTQGFSFKTTGLSGSKLSGIGLYGLTGQTASGAAAFTISLNDGSTTTTRTFGVGAVTDGAENALSSTFTLLASKTYTVDISGFATGYALADFKRIGLETYSVASGITDYWADPLKTGDSANTSLGIRLFYDSTSIPEPTTMILTGSALAAGAIGAYFKRRRKPQTEIAA